MFVSILCFFSVHLGAWVEWPCQTGYYKVIRKTKRWYQAFLYPFMNMAIVNAFLLHKDNARSKGEAPSAQKAFRETLAEELAELGSQRTATHTPSPAPHTTHRRLAQWKQQCWTAEVLTLRCKESCEVSIL